MKFDGKVIIVTGAGAGIGEATALLFSREGAKVCCGSLTDSSARVAEKINKAGGEAFSFTGDVSMEENAEKIVEETVTKFGRVDILFNNAGIVIPGKVDNTTPEDWDRTMAVNVRSVFLLSKFAIPHLIKTKGCIINNASSAALKGVKDRAPYSASKGALVSLTRAMAIDYVEQGVRVNCICPGTTESPSLTKRLSGFSDPESAKAQFISRQPMKRFGRPEEIADGVLYLALAEFSTGIILSVDGGMTV